jgi:transcriptional regulator with XRE-family HTH domain
MGRASRETPKRLGEKLLQIRTALGLSQDGMLRRLGLAEEYGRHYISGFETGEREPSLPVLLKYSEVARVWVNALVDDKVNLPERLPGLEMHAGTRRASLRKKIEHQRTKGR